MRKRSLLTLVAAVLLLAGACGGGDEGPDAGGNGDMSMAEPVPVTITASNFKFQPETFDGHSTHTVDLTFVNEDDVKHSFTIDELDVNVEAVGGQEATASFTPEEAGTYDYYCTYHPDMTGTFKVK